MQGPFELIPEESNIVQFVLYDSSGKTLQASATIASGDVRRITDQAASANTTNLPVNEGNGVYSLTLTAAECDEANELITVTLDDQTATETFLGTALQCRVLSMAEVASRFYSGPEGPGIYVDSGGTAGSTLGTHGTPDSPTTTWASALTLAGKLNINRFYITGSTTVTMTGSVAEYQFIGLGEFANNIVNLGSQLYSDATFKNLQITGTGSASSTRAEFVNCYLNGVTNLHCLALGCGFNGTLDLTNNDDHVFDQCFSMVAGGGTPTLDLASNIDVSMRHYSGGIEIANGGTTNSFSLEGHGQLVLAASTSNFSIEVRGAFKETDNGTNNTINNVASYNRGAAGGGADYAGGVWYDSAAATTGTVVGFDGTPGRPVSSIADAITLAKQAAGTGLNRIYCMSDVTLTADPGEVEFVGLAATTGSRPGVTGNSQNSLDTTYRALGLQGTWGSVSTIRAVDCDLSGTIPILYGDRVQIVGTLLPNVPGTMTLVGVTTFSTTAKLDMTTNSLLGELLDFAGDLSIANMDATNTLLIVGNGKLTIEASCTGGTIVTRGNITTTDNSGGAVTVTQDTGVNLVSINGEASPVLKLQAILDTTIDATITSGGGSVTSFSAAGIPTTNDDQLIDKTGVFIDGNAQYRGFVVTDYVDATKTISVDRLNVAPSNGDRFLIFA